MNLHFGQPMPMPVRVLLRSRRLSPWAPSAVLLAMFTGGCTHVGRTYEQINPEAAAADVRANTGYAELKHVKPGTTKLILRGDVKNASGVYVSFALSASDIPCEGFKTAGTTMQTGHGVLLPGIAKALEKLQGVKPFLVAEPKPGQSVQVQGYAMSQTESVRYTAFSKITTYYRDSCGPVTSQFTPLADHAYVVQFLRTGSAECFQQVTDATVPDLPVPVPLENLAGCARR